MLKLNQIHPNVLISRNLIAYCYGSRGTNTFGWFLVKTFWNSIRNRRIQQCYINSSNTYCSTKSQGLAAVQELKGQDYGLVGDAFSLDGKLCYTQEEVEKAYPVKDPKISTPVRSFIVGIVNLASEGVSEATLVSRIKE